MSSLGLGGSGGRSSVGLVLRLPCDAFCEGVEAWLSSASDKVISRGLP